MKVTKSVIIMPIIIDSALTRGASWNRPNPDTSRMNEVINTVVSTFFVASHKSELIIAIIRMNVGSCMCQANS